MLAEEEVDKVILAHYEAKFGCGTRALHYHLSQIYNKISEERIAKVVKASNSCGRMHPTFSNKGPKKIVHAKQVFERLQIDLVDLSRRAAFHNSVEFRYVLVIVDVFSRYMFLRPLTKKCSAEVCNHLELIFSEHGTPAIIQTDQGTEFQGLFDELCLKRNIRHIRSRAYHPQSQGKVERLNRSWKNKMFFDVLINGNSNWVASLSSYSQTYNTSKHRGLDLVMVKLSGKKFDLYKRKNIICPGVIMQTKEDDFLYLVQYEYNDRIQENWFFVDNITCRTVQEQEQRLASAAKRTRKENLHVKNAAKKMKTGMHVPTAS
ncbi:unnamed protein product [Rotaria sordida]|uniref:Integrase catalytic domain-containing protein n=1 Tax=Rotaria sordida TaxID=392033 RepID=A0A819HIJ0_9BILA|nr:unnamed protein product [Rotaria sordida]CAF3900844.1 unnamed protein product [Rotaria sordida]